jgi:hypothetical protein
MALTQFTVTGTAEPRPGGGAATGSYDFRLSAPIVDGATVLVPAQDIPAALDDTGSFSVALWAVDDTGTEPAGVVYWVSGFVNGVVQPPYPIVVSHTMAPTVALASIPPALPSTVYQSLPAGTGVDGGTWDSRYLSSQTIDGGTL